MVLSDASQLDREQSEEHRLVVVAYDSGKPRRSGQLNVTILVLDANDNSPVFEYNAYEVSTSIFIKRMPQNIYNSVDSQTFKP